MNLILWTRFQKYFQGLIFANKPKNLEIEQFCYRKHLCMQVIYFAKALSLMDYVTVK